MSRTLWKNGTWSRGFAGHRPVGGNPCVPRLHGLFSGAYFQEKLLQERNRALRSHKPLLVMVLDAEKIGNPVRPEQSGKITDALGEALHACVRESDICGILKEDALVGVILTEVEPEKVGAAQLIVAGKTREKLDALLSHETADRIGISFHLFPADAGESLFDKGSAPDLIATRDQDEA